MKRFPLNRTATLLLALCVALAGCGRFAPTARTDRTVLVATTYPVYCLVTAVVGDASEYEVELMISQPVSCLHDYTLSAADMRLLERADHIFISGGGLEDFLDAPLQQSSAQVIDCSDGVALKDGDPHYWLDPRNAVQMVRTIASHLALDGDAAAAELDALFTAATDDLADLSCRELVTFHDGFAYFADALDLIILMAIEEEEGAEASAKELAEVIDLVQAHQLPALFAEVNGSRSAAEIIERETGAAVFLLTTMLSPVGEALDGIAGYRAAFEYNVSALREALS